ncbi:hypothetical protein [Streptomyces sp. SID5910]|uniref:hypothetical protein n=1 Tax=Streptomyces sp. SID5910 TaxID=2690312 RepID=UPI0013ADCB0B|nr:hypothetical protein [Streptomyces sp. SID5910]MYR43103.1 hypothetical protein [Streptomyces sp. SID5910]
MTGAFHTIDAAMSPALGDVRSAGPGDLVYILPDATTRKDFPKYWEAAGVALSRGAQVVVVRRGETG